MKLGVILLKKELIEKYNIPFEGFTFVCDERNKVAQTLEVVKKIATEYKIPEISEMEYRCKFYEA